MRPTTEISFVECCQLEALSDKNDKKNFYFKLLSPTRIKFAFPFLPSLDSLSLVLVAENVDIITHRVRPAGCGVGSRRTKSCLVSAVVCRAVVCVAEPSSWCFFSSFSRIVRWKQFIWWPREKGLGWKRRPTRVRRLWRRNTTRARERMITNFKSDYGNLLLSGLKPRN